MTTQLTGYNLTVSANNTILSYDDIGKGSVPIIFLHGFPFDKSMWQLQLDFLKTTTRVIACDIRGFGKSTDETSVLSIGLFADDLIAFMDELKIETAIICGLSMGGFIALNMITRFPDRIEALILCDTQCIADTIEIKEKRYKTIDQINAEGVTLFNDGFLKSVFHLDSLNNKKELVKKLHNVVFANSQHIITAGLTALAERTETCSFLGEVTAPTMIICGREDTVTPLEQSELLLKSIHGSTLHIVEKAGHVSNLEHPEEFNNLISSFLVSLPVTLSAKASSTTISTDNNRPF
jgi:3-oxoadipate enol-lactonase